DAFQLRQLILRGLQDD
nr:Chain P, COREPRESSOR PEPTIDE [synthetic construct]2JFA_Q Chain Q, COREPRESSOR PEPTIDE [synthetic construct]